MNEQDKCTLTDIHWCQKTKAKTARRIQC